MPKLLSPVQGVEKCDNLMWGTFCTETGETNNVTEVYGHAIVVFWFYHAVLFERHRHLHGEHLEENSVSLLSLHMKLHGIKLKQNKIKCKV